jgi:uncharacterized protein (TIGR02284 family)
MSDSSSILPDLIEATREGGEFYAEAAVSVKDSELSKLFKRMAQAKSDLAQELSNEIAPKPAKPVRATRTKAAAKPAAKGAKKKEGWVGEIHAVYRGLAGGMKTIKQDQVSLIEEAENQVLGRVQQVRHDKANSYVVRVLAMQYETHARAMGEALRARKRRLTAV